MNNTEFIKKTDFEKLRDQKTDLFAVINNSTELSKEQKKSLENLLAFLDSFTFTFG